MTAMTHDLLRRMLLTVGIATVASVIAMLDVRGTRLSRRVTDVRGHGLSCAVIAALLDGLAQPGD